MKEKGVSARPCVLISLRKNTLLFRKGLNELPYSENDIRKKFLKAMTDEKKY
jgi:hypothetical protein